MRWLFRLLIAVAVVALVVAGLVALIPAQRIAQLAAAQFERATGRALVIEGEVRPRFWPVLGIETGPVRVANAEWSAAEAPLFAADRLDIAINAASLLGGELHILGIEAVRPRLVLEIARNGRRNWDFGATGGAGEDGATTAAGTGAMPLTLGKITLAGGSLRLIDWGAKTDVTYDDLDLTLKASDATGPFSFGLGGIALGRRFQIEGEGGSIAALIAGRLTPLDVRFALGKATADFSGRAGWQPLALEGRIAAEAANLPELVSASAWPEGMGAHRLSITGDLSLEGDGTIRLRNATINADDNTISGEMSVRPADPRPVIAAQLEADTLAFGGAGASATQDASAPGPAGWSRETIDVSALGLADGTITARIGSLAIGALRLGQTQVTVTIDRSRAVFAIGKLAAYEGSVSGEFVANGRGGLSVGGDLTFANIALQPLLSDLAGQDRLVARANLGLKFLGVGNSIDAIMHSLSGEGRATLGQGELRGLDIAGMLRTLDTSYVGEGSKTIFDGISGSFTIADGNLTNGDLKLTAPYLSATGAGRVGLGSRDLDYRLRPTALAAEDGTGGVMVPLQITGPWSNLSYRLDLESIARERMEAEAREAAKAAEEKAKEAAKDAEAKARSAAEDLLKEKTGIERREGESLEDAAKRRAQEILGGQAGEIIDGLLGGN